MTASGASRRVLLQALRSVPAGGSLLCLDDPEAAALLRERRGDRVVEQNFPAGGRLPQADRSFLTVLCLQGLDGAAAAQRPEIARELCRVAGRYVVIGFRHPALLQRRQEGSLTHRDLEALFTRSGFRPLARAARCPWLRPEWCSVFLRSGDLAGLARQR